MHFKVRRRLGLVACIPAFLFLFNPVVAFVDVLPDAIGYALLLYGLRQAADLNGRIEESRAGFQKMLYVSLGALLVEYYIYGILSKGSGDMNVYETPVWILLCSFVMLAFHVVFLLPAYRELFLGLGVLYEECGDAPVTDRKGRTRCERMASLSAVVAVLLPLFSCIPEISVLAPFEVEAEKMTFNWFLFVGLFRVIFAAASLILGFIWLVRVIRCMVCLLRKKEIIHALEERYTVEMLPQRGVLTLRRVGIAFWLLMIGALFIAELRFDYLSVIPTPVCALLFALALPFLGDFFQKRALFLIAAALQALCGTVQILFSRSYISRYATYDYALYNRSAYVDLCILQTVQILELLATLFLVGVLLYSLFRMTLSETAEVYANDRSGASGKSTKRLHRKFARCILISGASFFLYALIKVFEILLLAKIPSMWIASFVSSMLAIGSLFYLLYAIKDQLEWQYSVHSLNKI